MRPRLVTGACRMQSRKAVRRGKEEGERERKRSCQ